jgi:hypothetical protein
MSTVSLNVMLAAVFFAFILLANGNPIDENEKYDIVVCPEGAQAQNGRKHDVKIFPLMAQLFTAGVRSPSFIILSPCDNNHKRTMRYDTVINETLIF